MREAGSLFLVFRGAFGKRPLTRISSSIIQSSPESSGSSGISWEALSTSVAEVQAFIVLLRIGDGL